MMRVNTQHRLVLLLRTLGAGVLIGAVFGGTTGSGFHDASPLGVMLGVVAGAINGLAIAGAIFGAEIYVSPTRFGHALERVPFLVTFAMKVLAYGAVTTLVIGGGLGWRLVAIAPVPLSPDLAAAISEHIQTPVAPRMVRTFVLVGFAIFILQLSRLVGERTLRDIVLGRYHRARMEERFFLFVDIIGSTPLAERVGPGAVHRFLGEVFRLASDPIDEQRGEVHQYVGDEMVITWTVTEGRNGARPLACFFAIEQALARAAPKFEREFGCAARLRAALHAGPVIAGEVGGSRRAIVYHGDVMNTTSRIEQATRDLECQFLVSGDALERLADLEGFVCEDLGLRQLRGRSAGVQIYAVTAKISTNRQRAT